MVALVHCCPIYHMCDFPIRVNRLKSTRQQVEVASVVYCATAGSNKVSHVLSKLHLQVYSMLPRAGSNKVLHVLSRLNLQM